MSTAPQEKALQETAPAPEMGSKSVTLAAKNDVRSLIMGDAMRRQFALALPKICTPDRFVRVALTAVNKNPKLLSCTKESVLGCMMSCAELGIEPDGRRAHLIPYGNACTLIIDYKGLVELAMRSGTVSNIHADKVCEQDEFVFNRGKIEKHLIDFRGDRGKPYCYYAIVTMKDGSEKAEVMTVKEIEAIRKRSKAGGSGPWVSDFDEMAKKTCFRRAAKWIVLSPELRDLESKETEDGVIDTASALAPMISTSAEEIPVASGADGLAGAVE